MRLPLLILGTIILWVCLIVFTKEDFINTISSDYIQKEASLISQPNEAYLQEKNLTFFTDRLQKHIQHYHVAKDLIPQKSSQLHQQNIVNMVQEIFPEYTIPRVEILKVEVSKDDQYIKSLSRVILHRSYKHQGVALELIIVHNNNSTYLQGFTVLGVISEDKVHLPTPYNLSTSSVKLYQDNKNDSLIIPSHEENEVLCKYYQNMRVFRKLEPHIYPENKLCEA